MIVCYRSKAGHHDTTVHEKVAPAVVNENIVQKRHEEAQTAIDREVHQDHYHTSVQPVKDREVLPEKHSHNMVGVEERHHQHGNPEAIKARLEQEAAQFKSSRSVQQQESHSVAPVIAGEHVHHHVHEVSEILCGLDYASTADRCLDHPTSCAEGDNSTFSGPYYGTYP